MTNSDPDLWTPENQLWTPGSQALQLGRSLSADQSNPLVWRTKNGYLLVCVPQGGAFPPHWLVVGSTRGGKTSAIRYWVTKLLQMKIPKEIYLADGKFSGAFMLFEDLPGVVGVANDAQAIVTMVQEYLADVEEKYRILTEAMLTAKKTHKKAPYIEPPASWLILDDYFNWALGLQPAPRQEVIDALVRIASIGGEVNARLWIATQRPDSAKSIDAGLPGLLKSLLKVRISQAGVVGMDRIEALMAFDDTKAKDWLKAEAKRSGLKDVRGLGMIEVGGFRVAYKVPWMANPLHPLTSDEDREKAFKQLPKPIAEIAELDTEGVKDLASYRHGTILKAAA